MGVFTDTIPSFVVGRIRASKLATIASALSALTSSWTTYSVAWSSNGVAPAIGNGTLSGRYRRLGSTGDLFISLLMGSTTTFGTGIYTWTLPAAARSTFAMTCSATLDDAGSTVNCAVGTTVLSASTISLYHSTNYVGATSPYTFAVGDRVLITATLEFA